ncbi:MAG: HTTM domain-containing protein [Candidatus Eremiobacteraeota bacterium]|nr:HTTM domain-containing protein [Candidatus Eremiobacteraeota bacterium]
MELDLRSLATFRVLFSAVLILDCLTRWYDATAHYSDLGLLPRAVLLESGWHADFVSIHMMNGEPWFVHCLFAVQVALAVALGLGFRTRIATFFSWFLLISLHNRNPWVLNGGDVYARVVLFWMLFLPWGQVWSLDSRRKVSDRRWWMGRLNSEKKAVRSFAGVAVLIQICLIYWFAALPKTHPSWVGDYSAIQISLQLDSLVTPFGHAFSKLALPYLPTLTWMVLMWEALGPFLLWFPFDKGQVRTAAVTLFASLHFGFELCFEIGFFAIYSMVILSVLLPSWFWDRPLSKLSRWLDQKTGGQDIAPDEDRPKARRSAEAVYLFLIIYICCWNFGNEQFRPGLWLPDSWDWIGHRLRLDQRWNMFSPSPPYQDGWWVVKGIRRSGKEVNLLAPGSLISWEKPEDIAGSYLTQRRRRWMMELRSTNDERLMAAYCRFLCSQINGPNRSLHEVRFVELYYMLEMTEADGSEREPVKYLLYKYDNFPPTPVSPSNVIVPKEESP